MKNTIVGLCLVLGAGLGTLVGVLLSKDISLFAGYGTGIGIIVGSIIYLLKNK